MKNKRGISPIVATVLLVAIVIIIALLIWFWYNQFIEEQSQKANSELAQECAETEIQLREVTCQSMQDSNNNDIYRVTIDIANTGSSRVSELVVTTTSQTSSVTDEVAKVISEGTTGEITMDILKSEINLIDEIQVVPAVSAGQTLKYCEEQIEYSSPTCS